MLVTLVQVHVKPEFITVFVEACRKNHEASTREPGNRRFDILQSNDNPSYFVLYEAYASREDVAAHKETPHYKAWRDTVAGWMAEPRHGEGFTGLYPV